MKSKKDKEEKQKKIEIITVDKSNTQKKHKPKLIVKQNKPEKKEDINIVYYDKNQNKTINKKKIAVIIVFIIFLLCCLGVFLLYASNVNVRNFFDYKILRKDIEENNLKTIEIQDPDKSTIIAYSKYIAIMKESNLELYNSSGKKETSLKIQISTPALSKSGEYLLIAEENSSKAYLIQDNIIKWEKDLDGDISRVTVNENGYSAVVLSGTAYKSVIVLYDNSGSEIFKTYLSSTIAVDVDISQDNKYLAFAEVNTSGTKVQSNIKIISIEKAKTTPSDAIIYTYNANSNELVIDIKYQKNKLICRYDDSICKIENNENTVISNLKEQSKKYTFSSIELYNNAVQTLETSKGLFSYKTDVEILNTVTQKTNVYTFDGVTKKLYTYGDKMAFNLGTEVHFINTNGWLVKKYTSTKEIKDIVITNSIAGIVYRDKIEIINL